MWDYSFRRMLRQVAHTIKGYPFYTCLKELEASQYWPRAQLEAIQDEKVRKLVKHAYENVPYYRRRMQDLKLCPADVRCTEDLAKLPILGRGDVRDYNRELHAEGRVSGKPITGKTGGTTGTPLRVSNDFRGQAWSNAAHFRGLGWAGYDLDRDLMVTLWGGSLAGDRQIVGVTKWLEKKLFLSAYDIRGENIERYLDAFRAAGPCFLKAYAGAAYVLATRFEELATDIPSVRAVFTTSEQLPLSQRKTIERVFNTTVYDYYGSVEINSVGYECQYHDGYHIPEEHVYVETMRDSGNSGDFIITDLDNYYMPMIRYKNGDAGELTDVPCPCGRQLRRIGRLHGRVSDLLRSTSGELIDGGMVDYVLGETESIREFTLTQETRSLCRLEYVARRDGEIPLVIDRLKQFLGAEMTIEATRVSCLPLTSSGKRRFTRSLL